MTQTDPAATVLTRAARELPPAGPDVDPILTEVVRQGLNAAALQMRQAFVRTSFSPIIYEVYDFACAIYDAEYRLLSQALGLQHFMGRLSFCVALAVEAVGGVERLEEGDVLLYNVPYGTGAHAQDAAIVMPVFHDGAVVGYTAIKAHWLDIGGKDPYSTDTVDVFQEGTIFPGVKLVRAGVVCDDILRIVTANSRVPDAVAGDLQAEIVGVRTGAQALVELLDKHGPERFWACVARMFAHGESTVRSYFEQIPDGTYTAWGEMDDNGVETDPIPFRVSMTVQGSDVTVDFSEAPGMQAGPVNCPLPATIAATRVAIMMLAGGGEAPNEGYFAPVSILTRPGSMFHAQWPAPCFLYGWPAIQAIEVIFHAIADARPQGVPASSGGCVCGLVWWGVREETGEPWADGAPQPIGAGAHPDGDGASALMHIAQTAARTAPVEVFEARFPLRIARADLACDSGGPGRNRGGLGVDMDVVALEDCWLTTVVERTRNAPWGLAGGGEARPNGSTLRRPDGSVERLGKKTRVRIPRGSVLELRTGGGGGFGPAAERDVDAVRADVRDGYVSEARARLDYPHAF
ncbi:MAG: hydantoinase B/oxoprolinase family protein [Thermoleophilia bacterium]